MIRKVHFGWDNGWVLRAAAVFLIASSLLAASRLAKAPKRTANRPSAGTGALFQGNAPSSSGRYFQVRRYFLDFAGDHSLSTATVTEQASAGDANYTVELRLASGAEQSVTVAGPPGGLRIEMQDMTGDDVPNDVILRPALFSRLSAVLVNDGHDHFAVVEAGANPGDVSSPENLGSRHRPSQTFALLRSSGFKSIHLPATNRTLVPQLRRALLCPFAHSFACASARGSRLGRAPPVPTAI